MYCIKPIEGCMVYSRGRKNSSFDTVFFEALQHIFITGIAGNACTRGRAQIGVHARRARV
jgi:hypothetical protein